MVDDHFLPILTRYLGGKSEVETYMKLYVHSLQKVTK